MQQTLLLNSCPIQSLAANIAAPIRLHCFLSQVVWWHFIFFPFLLEVGTSEGHRKSKPLQLLDQLRKNLAKKHLQG
jgi:hypothetical protein